MQNRRLPTEAHSCFVEIAIIFFAISLAVSCLEPFLEKAVLASEYSFISVSTEDAELN